MNEPLATEAPSLQKGIDQIGNLIDGAHKILDRICMDGDQDEDTKPEPALEGAEPGVNHCSQGMERLIERLTNIAVRVGHL